MSYKENHISEISNGDAMDKILKYSIEHGDFISLDDVKKNVLTSFSANKIEHLFYLMNEYLPKVITLEAGRDYIGIMANEEAAIMLKNGGFKLLEEKEKIVSELNESVIISQIKQSKSIQEANEENKKNADKLMKIQNIQLWFTVILIIIGSFSVIDVICKVFLNC
jgi:hypothetical protein